MPIAWEFEHSVFTTAHRRDAWAFWSDLNSHIGNEPGVERIELDGPFESGTKGRTIAKEYQQEWELVDVIPEVQAAIVGAVPGAVMRFAWKFADENDGTRLTQCITLEGPQAADYIEIAREFESNAPQGMAKLAAELDRRAQIDR